MNWVPQFIDKPVVFFYSLAVWRIVLVLTYVLLVTGMSQMKSLGVGLAVGFVIQKVEAGKPMGFIHHWGYRHLGIPIKGFLVRPSRDRSMRL